MYLMGTTAFTVTEAHSLYPQVLAHVEDHQAHLNHVHQHLRNEIALLELKKRQLDEESKQEGP